MIEERYIDCIKNLVGVTKRESDCFSSMSVEKKDKLKLSTSGLFLDEESRLNNCILLDKAKCGEADIFDEILTFKKNASKELLMDLGVRSKEYVNPIVDKHITYGKTEYGSQMIGLPAGKKSFRINTSSLMGGKIHIQHAGFIAQLPQGVWSEIVTINISKITRDSSFVETATALYSFNFRIDNTNKFMLGKSPSIDYVELPEGGIELPTDGSSYEFSYEYDPTKFNPYSNDVDCASCQKARAETSMIYQGEGVVGEAYGMTFSARVYCESVAIACSLVKSDTAVALMIANALRCKTLCFVLDRLRVDNKGILRIPSVLQGGDKSEVDMLIEVFNDAYNNYLEEILSGIKNNNIRVNCFTCKTGLWGVRSGMIH